MFFSFSSLDQENVMISFNFQTFQFLNSMHLLFIGNMCEIRPKEGLKGIRGLWTNLAHKKNQR